MSHVLKATILPITKMYQPLSETVPPCSTTQPYVITQGKDHSHKKFKKSFLGSRLRFQHWSLDKISHDNWLSAHRVQCLGCSADEGSAYRDVRTTAYLNTGCCRRPFSDYVAMTSNILQARR